MTAESAAPRLQRARSLAAAVPTWAWLAGIVAASALIRYALGRRTVAPWIMVDELIYSELAKSFADTGRFLVRDHATAAYGVVYPVLVAPAWAFFDAVPDAYAAAKAINALVMSLAAVPAYFLARRVLSPGLSVAAAALTVAVPSMAYTATLMTENAFYPLFLAAALAMVLWLERPTPVRTAVLLGVCALAYLTRAQALALLPALLTAPLLVAGRAALRRYRLLYGAAAAGVLLVVIVQAVRGASPLGVFGAYEVAGRADYTVSSVAKWFVYHVAELDLALGILPFAALVLLVVLLPRLSERDRVVVAVSASLSFWLVLEVAVFASEQTFRIEERNMFYVMPLFLVCLLVWVERGCPRPRAPALFAAAVAGALPAVVPYDDLIGLNAVSDTLALLPLGWLVEKGLPLGDVDLVVLGGSLASAAAFLAFPRRYAALLPLLVVAYFAVSQQPIEEQHRYRSVQHLYGGIAQPHLDWIDRALGADSGVSLLWTGVSDKFTVWENELFNRSVGTIYTTGPAVPGGLAQTPLDVDRGSGLMRGPDDRFVDATYVLTDASGELDGDVILRDAPTGMQVYAVAGFLRQLALVEGLYPRDTWSRRVVTYTRHDCRGGTLGVELQSDPALYARPNAVVARVGGRVVGSAVVGPREFRRLTVPLESTGGRCVVRFTVARTAVPSVVSGGRNADPRALGIHFNRFTYRP